MGCFFYFEVLGIPCKSLKNRVTVVTYFYYYHHWQRYLAKFLWSDKPVERVQQEIVSCLEKNGHSTSRKNKAHFWLNSELFINEFFFSFGIYMCTRLFYCWEIKQAVFLPASWSRYFYLLVYFCIFICRSFILSTNRFHMVKEVGSITHF